MTISPKAGLKSRIHIEISLASIEFGAWDVQKTEAGMSEDKATEVHG